MHGLFVKGGPLMYPLLICSLISLAITIERIIFWVRENLRCDSKGLNDILHKVEKGNFEEALLIGRESKDSVIRVI